MKNLLTLAVFGIAVTWIPDALSQAFNDFQKPPHSYYDREPTDPMSQLINAAEAGEFDFGTESGLPLVKKMLKALDIPESSQVIVFSQTSLQRSLISSENPRAMFFNEDTHLAWMPGGKVEVISFDPQTGGRFYFEEPPKNPGEKVGFVQPRSCFGCHGGSATNFLPGPLARSHYTAKNGRRVRAVADHIRLGHTVPFESRWGGYFVTNAPANLEHLGNTFASREGQSVVLEQPEGSLSDLSAFFDEKILPRGDSNVIPLLLFDHQIEAHNLLMEALYRHRHLEAETAKSEDGPRERTVRGTERLFDKLVRYLLFADEVSLEGYDFERNPEFESDFQRNSRKASDGTSLKDFNLEDRIFENRLSYLIYSRSFEEAPQEMRDRVYSRLWDILTPASPPEGYDYFDPGERARIVKILQETKDDLPAIWRGEAGIVSSDR